MCNMDENPKVLDFVKAVSDAERLRIIGLLAQHAATTQEVADQLNMPFREAFKHLGQLEFAGVVYKTGDAFSLNDEALGALSRGQFSSERQSYVPAPELDAKARKVLATYLNADGSLKQIPLQAAKLQIILLYLAAAFEPRVDYSEKEVNTILRRFHADTASLRRELVEARLLTRESDGSRYWRTEDATR
jgi:hypothetical protein